MSKILSVWSHPEPDLHDQLVADLRRSAELAGPFEPRASLQSWEEAIYSIIADGTAVANSTTEAIMVPDFSLPANYMYQGRTLRYTLWGKLSTVITTPGTITHRLRWGGVAGTILAASGAHAPDPTAASTDLTFVLEFTLVCRSVGTSGSILCFGRRDLGDYDDASATSLKGNLDMNNIPASAPAAVTVDTTIAKALSPTVQFSVTGAGTTTTTMAAILETLN